MRFKRVLSMGLAIGLVATSSLNTFAIELNPYSHTELETPLEESISIKAPLSTSSEEFIVNKSVAISLFIRGLATPTVEDSPEEENIISVLDLGVQARACLTYDKKENKNEHQTKSTIQTTQNKVIVENIDNSSNVNIRKNIDAGKFYLPQCPLSEELQQHIYNLAIEKNIPVDMMFTVPMHESSYNPKAISKTNDYGLYQFNICNHKNYSKMCGTPNTPLDPYVSAIWASTMISGYLRQFEEQYPNDYMMVVDRTLSCYNGGPGSKLRTSYLAGYDKCHKTVAQWMIEAGYEHLVKAY